jgi:hypothetical protein
MAARLLDRLRDPSEKTLGLLLLTPAFLLLLMIVVSTAVLDYSDNATDHEKRGDKRMTNA